MILYYLKSSDKFNSIALTIEQLAINNYDVKLHVCLFKKIPKKYKKHLNKKLGVCGHASKLEAWR